jgi:hypothetical protein
MVFAAKVSSFFLLALLVLTFVSGDAVAQSRFLTFERNVDRPGFDYSNTPSLGAEDCSFACQLENRCRAFTFVRPGVQGPSARCYLKTAVPRARRSACCTSGFRKAPAGRID